MHPGVQRIKLVAHLLTTKDRSYPDPTMTPKAGKFAGHLHCELASRHQYQALNLTRTGIRHFDKRNAEGGCFSGARLGLSYNITSFSQEADDRILYRCRNGVAHLRKCPVYLLRNLNFAKKSGTCPVRVKTNVMAASVDLRVRL